MPSRAIEAIAGVVAVALVAIWTQSSMSNELVLVVAGGAFSLLAAWLGAQMTLQSAKLQADASMAAVRREHLEQKINRLRKLRSRLHSRHTELVNTMERSNNSHDISRAVERVGQCVHELSPELSQPSRRYLVRVQSEVKTLSTDSLYNLATYFLAFYIEVGRIVEKELDTLIAVHDALVIGQPPLGDVTKDPIAIIDRLNKHRDKILQRHEFRFIQSQSQSESPPTDPAPRTPPQ